EPRELARVLVRDLVAEARGNHGDLALDAPALRLERERPGIPRRQGVLDAVEARRVVARRRRVEQAADVVVNHLAAEASGACRRSAQVSGLGRPLRMGRPDYLPPPAGLFLKVAVTRRSLIALLVLAALATPVVAVAQEAPLQARLARALRVPHVAPARSGAVAMDLGSGAVVFTQTPSLPLAPASNEKLPLTYAAVSNLGPSYRIETDVLGEGSQDGVIFDGALVLKG